MSEEIDEVVESSPTESPSTESAPVQAEAAETPEAKAPEAPKEVPFHEHPRFKEIIEQKNQFQEQLKKQEIAYNRLQAQFEMMQKASQPKVESETDKLYQDLEKIDPRLAKHLRNLEEKTKIAEEAKAKASEWETWKTQQEAERTYNQAVTELNRLHVEYKVPKELTEFYDSQVRAVAAQNPNLQVKDLPAVYKSIHDKFTSYFEAEKRKTLATYTDTKKADAKAPAPIKKGQAPGAKKMEYSSNAEEAKAQVIKQILKRSAAQNDI